MTSWLLMRWLGRWLCDESGGFGGGVEGCCGADGGGRCSAVVLSGLLAFLVPLGRWHTRNLGRCGVAERHDSWKTIQGAG